MSEPILFDCEIRQVKTMADHSVNLTLNIPEYNNEQAGQLLRQIGEFGKVALLIVDMKLDEK